jgi:integrase/recombinase XerD
MLARLAKKVGIGKPVRPHLMRHSLATYYAPMLTEAVMNEHFGWRQGGRTASIYTHLSGKQVDEQILSIFGKRKVDTETNRAVALVRCSRCGLENVPSSIQCGKCGFPLSDEAARELSARRQRADEILDAALEHPEVLEAMRRVVGVKNGSGGQSEGHRDVDSPEKGAGSAA